MEDLSSSCLTLFNQLYHLNMVFRDFNVNSFLSTFSQVIVIRSLHFYACKLVKGLGDITRKELAVLLVNLLSLPVQNT